MLLDDAHMFDYLSPKKIVPGCQQIRRFASVVVTRRDFIREPETDGFFDVRAELVCRERRTDLPGQELVYLQE
ncbi:hypothetical protein AFB00_14730 [Pseudonocardia sp. HH130630-07]|nr:hypothetical protein AFB00_14730 [Pseudonocardia sp. HH130630-07]